MTNGKMSDSKGCSTNIFGGQMDFAAQKKRNAIIKRLDEQKEEELMLERTKRELMEDCSSRYRRRYEIRKDLESHWRAASAQKRNREKF